METGERDCRGILDRKIRAVIYNRCSTEEESQKDALIKQVQESRNCVAKQGWQLVDAYVEAKSGTTVKGRSEYSRLYLDLETDKFDIIVIKSQDRLMRNTKDWYLFLDRMQKNRKRLYMYLERKFYTPDDALITGIKAILAEEYSRELSKKINNAHQNRQKEGKRFVFTNQMYGLRKLPDKSVVIEEREAEMIRMIFGLSAKGVGTHCSAELLYQAGYKNHSGKRLSPSVIHNIIRNPIYKGTVVQNRQHYDFDSKQILKNPESDWIFHEGAVPAIVDEELFERANRGLDERKVKNDFPEKEEKGGAGRYPVRIRRIYKDGTEHASNGRYVFSGKICCGLCGGLFYRTRRKRKEDTVTEWKCRSYLQSGRKTQFMRKEEMRKVKKEEGSGCDNVHLDENKLRAMLGQLCGDTMDAMLKTALQKQTMDIMGRVLCSGSEGIQREKTEALQEKLYRQKALLLEKLLEGIISDGDYQEKSRELQGRLEQIGMQLKELENKEAVQEERMRRQENIRIRLNADVIDRAFLEAFVENIRKIEVYPSYLELYFPDGMVMEAKAWKNNDAGIVKREADGSAAVRVFQSCSTSHKPLMQEEKRKILDLMKQKPGITAREISEEMGVSLSLVHRRIQTLKEEGRIRYSVPNGRGEWMIWDEQ